MTPAARLQAAIEILEGLGASDIPADRFIRDWFRTRRYAGSKDRAAVAERVFDVFRHRASYGWRMQSEAPRALVVASVLAEQGDPAALFTGGYGPAPLDDAERAAIANVPADAPPLPARFEFPAFLEAELVRSLGDGLESEMTAMLARAPVDLRVNTLKAEPASVLDRLTGEGFDARPAPFAPEGIRLDSAAGLARLHQSEGFKQGLFEFQDEAAQIAAALGEARPGMRVLDLAAGAGGKALALASAMNNLGELIACDIDAGRLRQIGPRAERAGAAVIRSREGEAPKGPFDLVFVDAPCSGSGTWRRQPEQKWRLTAARVDALEGIQDELLDQAAARMKPTGRIVYATCSLLKRENEDRIAAFLARHPDFAVRPAKAAWHGADIPGLDRFFRATPATTGTDGFFAAILVHKDTPCAD